MHHFLDLGGEHLGHAHAAVFGIATDADPAAFGEGLIGLAEALGRGDLAVLPVAAFFIGIAIERRQFLGAQLAGFFEDGIGGLAVHHLGQGGPLTPAVLDLEDGIQHETDIAKRRGVVSHVESPRKVFLSV